MNKAGALIVLLGVACGAIASAQTPQTYPSDQRGGIVVWGLQGQPQSAELPYSIAYHNGELRLEARQGDRRRKASESDRPIERSEVSFPDNPFEFGQTYNIRFEVLFEGDTPTGAANDKFFQIHNVNDPGDGTLGPIFAMQLERDRTRIVVRSDPNAVTANRVADVWIFRDHAVIERNRWYRFAIRLRVDPHGHGIAAVTRDGVDIATYVGPLGYNDAAPPYPKVGVYRDTAPDIQARRFRALSIERVS